MSIVAALQERKGREQRRELGFALAVIAVPCALPLVLPSYALAMLIIVFAIAALGANFLFGQVGLLSFGQGIFFGLGAYAAALAALKWGFGVILSLVVALAVGTAVAAMVGFASTRRRGVYFVLLTFAFANMFAFLTYLLSDLTGGENGLAGVPRPPLEIGGLTILDMESLESLYMFTAVIFVIVYVVLRRVVHSPFGSALRAVRDNEDRARAIGYDTRSLKAAAFTLAGAVAALGGGLFAFTLSFVAPSVIGIQMSGEILIMALVGGTGSLYGAILGATGIVVVTDVLADMWARGQMVLGFALIGLVLWLRGGLWEALERGRAAVAVVVDRHRASWARGTRGMTQKR